VYVHLDQVFKIGQKVDDYIKEEKNEYAGDENS
jgi:hypothetical protein